MGQFSRNSTLSIQAARIDIWRCLLSEVFKVIFRKSTSVEFQKQSFTARVPLRSLFLIVFAASLFMSVGTNINWVTAVCGVGFPCAGWALIAIERRAGKSLSSSRWQKLASACFACSFWTAPFAWIYIVCYVCSGLSLF